MLAVSLAVLTLFADVEMRAPLIGGRCGRIVIQGNTDTPDRVVLNLIDIRPGQRILPGMVAESRARIRASGAFKANPWRGTGPVVELLPNEFDGTFYDLSITIEERPANWFVFGVLETVGAAKNLDPERGLDELWRLALRAKERVLGER
jgi:Surface antigen variable number repeat